MVTTVLAALRKACFALFALLCLETIFAVPYRSVQLATQNNRWAWIAALIVIGVVALGLTLKNGPLQFVERQVARLRQGAELAGFIRSCLLLGIVLRMFWAFSFQVPLKSDGLSYFQLAVGLAQSHSYQGDFYPPGYPLFLFPFITILGAHVWVTAFAALLLFVLTFRITCSLAKQTGGVSTVPIAALLIAIWPGYFSLVGVAAKELLLAVLVPGSVLAYLSAGNHRGWRNWGLIAVSGALVGLASLTQPGYLLFPTVFVAVEIFRRKLEPQAVLRFLLVTVAMLVMVAPWTYRNLLTLHRYVLVTTNGGSVFYRANNPNANAAFSASGEIDLPRDEFEADKKGYEAGFRWIHDNPVAFLKLSIRKQITYLGDDAVGIYETLKRSGGITGPPYALAKAIANAFWLGVWIFIIGNFRQLSLISVRKVGVALCMVPLIYQWGLDSVFESGSRHHTPYIPLIAVLTAIALLGQEPKTNILVDSGLQTEKPEESLA